jgi:hypothetical protein
MSTGKKGKIVFWVWTPVMVFVFLFVLVLSLKVQTFYGEEVSLKVLHNTILEIKSEAPVAISAGGERFFMMVKGKEIKYSIPQGIPLGMDTKAYFYLEDFIEPGEWTVIMGSAKVIFFAEKPFSVVYRPMTERMVLMVLFVFLACLVVWFFVTALILL